VKRAGELLSSFLDERFLKKALNYKDLFSCWEVLTRENRIAAAAAHSRIRELEGTLLVIEADHPGWVQILHTKQRQLLEGIIRRFPDLTITGISFRLSREGPK
jgi:predicted nucleic acid-binding Zn ribbon protein